MLANGVSVILFWTLGLERKHLESERGEGVINIIRSINRGEVNYTRGPKHFPLLPFPFISLSSPKSPSPNLQTPIKHSKSLPHHIYIHWVAHFRGYCIKIVREAVRNHHQTTSSGIGLKLGFLLKNS